MERGYVALIEANEHKQGFLHAITHLFVLLWLDYDSLFSLGVCFSLYQRDNR